MARMRSSFPVFRREIRQNIQAGLLTLDFNFFTTPSHFKCIQNSGINSEFNQLQRRDRPRFSRDSLLSKAPDVGVVFIACAHKCQWIFRKILK